MAKEDLPANGKKIPQILLPTTLVSGFWDNLGIRPVYETLVREAIPGLRKKKWVVYWRLKILIIVLVQRSYGKAQRVEALVQGSLISSKLP